MQAHHYPPIIQVVINNNEKLINSLLMQENLDIDERGLHNETALYVACQLGYKNIVKALLTKNANPCIFAEFSLNGEHYKQTPLHTAIGNKHIGIALLLILSNPSCIHIPNHDGWYPLHMAAELGFEDLVGVMIKNHASINEICNRGVTPLYLAAQNGHVEVIKLLLEQGADPIKTKLITPLSVAVQNNQIEAVETLLAWPHSNYLICQALGKTCENKMLNILNNKLSKNLSKYTTLTSNIPRVIHFIYLNEIPDEYIYGGEINTGLYGICKKAAEDGYEVNLWVPNPDQFNQTFLRNRPRLNGLLDCDQAIAMPNLQIKNICELNSEIGKQFTEANGFDADFVKDLRLFINSEQIKNFNLAAVSNILRLVILALKGGIYCDMSKTLPRNANINSFNFDCLRNQTRYGFSQCQQGNYLLISEKMHTVVLETLKLIVRNYRLLYKVSFGNLTGKYPAELSVLKDQHRGGKVRFFFTMDPLQYARSQKNSNYRESSTELLNGVYPIQYGEFQYALQAYSKYNNKFNYTVCLENRLDCISDNLYSDYRFNENKSTDMSAGDFIETFNINKEFFPSINDWSINPYPLGSCKEKIKDQRNWRELVKVYHEDSSISLLFKGIKKDKYDHPCELDSTLLAHYFSRPK